MIFSTSFFIYTFMRYIIIIYNRPHYILYSVIETLAPTPRNEQHNITPSPHPTQPNNFNFQFSMMRNFFFNFENILSILHRIF